MSRDYVAHEVYVVLPKHSMMIYFYVVQVHYRSGKAVGIF